MVFQGICLITENVARMRAFYQTVLQCGASGDDIHTEILSQGMPFVLYDRAASERDMLFTYPEHAGYGHTTLSFRVQDVDREYARLSALGISFMTKPKDYPWGARSVHFRDPDGNIITFVRPPLQNMDAGTTEDELG